MMLPDTYPILEFEIDTSGIVEYSLEVEATLRLVVELFANYIKAKAQYYVPVDQGTAKNSIYVVTENNSQDDYIKSVEEAASMYQNSSRWGHEGRLGEFWEFDDEVRPLHAIIAVAVVYGVELEYGGMSPHPDNHAGVQLPFLTPAVADYRDPFFAAVGKALALEFNK